MKYKFFIHIIIYLILCFNISAHPHVFFETFSDIKINDNIIEGVEIHLILDEMNTKLNEKILKSSGNKDNIDPNNIVFLNKIFSHIHLNYGDVTCNNDNIIFEQAKLKDNNLEIFLFFPIDKKVEKNKKLKISFYDKKYYFNYDYNEDSISIDKKYKINFYTNKKISFYFKLIHPEEYEIIF